MRDGGRPSSSGQSSMAGRLGTFAITILAGLMITVSALAARGEDLRADRAADLRILVADQIRLNENLLAEAEALRDEVRRLSEDSDDVAEMEPQLQEAGRAASTGAVVGPGVRVVLTDAPLDVNPDGVSDNVLVVHQQDIQAVVNALWAGGAEAMSLQGQRVIATTAVKCVGNSVVLHGTPYAPPYVIDAIGPVEEMEAALANSRSVQVYQQYAEAYGLGYRQERLAEAEVPAFSGPLGVSHAQPIR